MCEGWRGRKGIHEVLDPVRDTLSGCLVLLDRPVFGMVGGNPPTGARLSSRLVSEDGTLRGSVGREEWQGGLVFGPRHTRGEPIADLDDPFLQRMKRSG